MSWTYPTVDDFKNFFVRDFQYGLTPSCVMDTDINKAQLEAKALFNVSLYSSNDVATIAYQYISAHFLLLDLKRATEGVNATTGGGILSSASVGDVSESYTIPMNISSSSQVAYYNSTSYGQKYYALTQPRIIGSVDIVGGYTQP